MAAGCVEVGASSNMNLDFSETPASATTVTLTAMPAGIVNIPASVVIPADNGDFTLPIIGVAAGTATITASVAGGARSASLTVVQNSAIIPAVANSIGSGMSAIESLSSECALAAPVTVTVASANPAALTITPTTVTLVPASQGTNAFFSMTGVAAGTSSVSFTAPAPYVAPAAINVTVTP